MSRATVESRVRVLVAAAAAVMAVCAAWLTVDYFSIGHQAPAESARVLELAEQAKTDARAAVELAAERERGTTLSARRERRSQVLAWTLFAAAVVFVGAMQWRIARREPALPGLDDLVQIRVGSAMPHHPVSHKAAGNAGSNGSGEVDLAFVDALVARFGTSREMAIPILQALQDHYRFLPGPALERICATTEITPAQIAGTSSFYAHFRRTPVGRYLVRVCHGTACHVAGIEPITEELRRYLEIPEDGDTDPDKRFTIDPVACLGCCSLAPVMMIEDATAGHLTPASACATLAALADA